VPHGRRRAALATARKAGYRPATIADAREIAAVSSPVISVALSVYNGARYLPEQLDSVLAQRNVAIELVAVDDGSTDDSVALLHDYARRDPRMQVHVNPVNLGATRSFERAMALGHGELIAPCDQDDRWHPDKLATLLAALGDRDLAYCNSRYIDERGQPTGRCISDDLVMMHGQRPLSFVFANSVSGHAALLRRSLFDAARPLPPALYYDWLLAMAAAAGNGIVYVERPLVEFRRHAQAFSTLGKQASYRPASRQRGWLRDRQRLADVLATSRADPDRRAERLSAALALAVGGRSRWPLLAWIWRERERIAPEGRQAIRHALHLQSRLLRKLRRARREPPLPPDDTPPHPPQTAASLDATAEPFMGN
jgi:glycosyltransferase involved in cell wall biosynthesis